MVYGILCMELKDKILKTLQDFGKLPTSRIAGIVGMNNDRAKEILEELVNKNKIIKIEETVATYWEIKNGKRNY